MAKNKKYPAIEFMSRTPGYYACLNTSWVFPLNCEDASEDVMVCNLPRAVWAAIMLADKTIMPQDKTQSLSRL